MSMKKDFRLPQIDKILREPALTKFDRLKRELVTRKVRMHVDKLRASSNSVGDTTEAPCTASSIAEAVAQELEQLLGGGVKKVLNGTGVILSTNLGRAPLPVSAVDQLREALCGYSNLEFSLTEGTRGERTEEVSQLLSTLIGSESAIVVNNCASAVMLAVKALSDQKETIVSRGELIEIGGSFRLPDVITSSGGLLKEVGTTNRTRAADYEKAISPQSGMLLKCHRSNYQVLGFTEEAEIKQLGDIGRQHGIPVVYDLGGGCLIDLSKYDLTPEPTVQNTLANGADLVLFSGDKLLGGPQAGIIAGKKEIVARLRKCPIYRALRADKLVIALLESVLKQYLYVDGHQNLPVFQFAALSQSSIMDRALEMTRLLEPSLTHIKMVVVETESTMGGGSLPGELLPSAGLALSVVTTDVSTAALARQLRCGDPPLIGKIEADRLIIDLRTIAVEEQSTLAAAIQLADANLAGR